jgi:hypothetical protein
MLSIPISLDKGIEQRLPPTPIPGDIRRPYQHHNNNLGSRRPTLSTWRTNLLRDPAWRPMRHHDATAHRFLTDDQEREVGTDIANEYIDRNPID